MFGKQTFSAMTSAHGDTIFVFSFVQFGFSLSNWQKVQLNTDFLKHRTRYLYTKEKGQLKLNVKKECLIKSRSN